MTNEETTVMTGVMQINRFVDFAEYTQTHFVWLCLNKNLFE